jgi:hypothetical protein
LQLLFAKGQQRRDAGAEVLALASANVSTPPRRVTFDLRFVYDVELLPECLVHHGDAIHASAGVSLDLVLVEIVIAIKLTAPTVRVLRVLAVLVGVKIVLFKVEAVLLADGSSFFPALVHSRHEKES